MSLERALEEEFFNTSHNQDGERPPPETPEQIVSNLSKLSALEYESVRESEAKKLKFRASALDKMVRQLQNDNDTENDDVVTSDEPYQGVVNGDAVLCEIEKLIKEHLILPKGALAAVVLWIASTYVYDAFRVFPKLAVISPEKRCGKTTLLDALAGLCNRSLIASNITPSAIFRSVDLWKPTLIIDEADTFMAGRNDDLIGIINSGHTKSTAFVIRTVGDDFIPKKFSTWAPMAFASIGGIVGTVMDRSIKIQLRRRTVDERVQRLSVDFKNECLLIRQKLAKWAEDNIYKLKQNPIEPPEIANDRAIDNWLPLFNIAHVVGGKWPDAVESSYFILEGADKEETVAIMLLRDIREIFENTGKTRILSRDLVDELVELEERPWCEWKRGQPMTQNSLAKILKTFGIHSKLIRIGNLTSRGVERAQFDDVFARYIPNTPIQGVTTLHPSYTKVCREYQSVTSSCDVTLSKTLQAMNTKGCNAVTLQNPVSEDEGEF